MPTLPRTLAAALTGLAAATVLVGPARAEGSPPVAFSCPPSASATGYSDKLDKVTYRGAQVGGLSDIAYDAQRKAYASTVDNHGSDLSRIWLYRDLTDPRIVGSVVLRRADGTAYDGTTADNEGLAVLPDGDYLVSSETEPSIRVFGRDGVQKASLPVPDRFRVAPAGQATANATLEGLSISPDGHTVVASMEGSLAGDPADERRLLVYRERGGQWRVVKELGYTVDPGFRVAEVQQYAAGRLLVLEAAYDPATGNAVRLYATVGFRKAVLAKREVTDVTGCPSLGAPAKQTQANPLLDNYEGMTTRPLSGDYYQVTLVSDDNFNPTQITRLLTLDARLP